MYESVMALLVTVFLIASIVYVIRFVLKQRLNYLDSTFQHRKNLMESFMDKVLEKSNSEEIISNKDVQTYFELLLNQDNYFEKRRLVLLQYAVILIVTSCFMFFAYYVLDEQFLAEGFLFLFLALGFYLSSFLYRTK